MTASNVRVSLDTVERVSPNVVATAVGVASVVGPVVSSGPEPVVVSIESVEVLAPCCNVVGTADSVVSPLSITEVDAADDGRTMAVIIAVVSCACSVVNIAASLVSATRDVGC